MRSILEQEVVSKLLEDFCEYQIDWLTSHNDIEFQKDEEDLIIGFLKDTNYCYQKELIECYE